MLERKTNTRYFSESTLGFYLYDGMRQDIPDDASEITEAEYLAAMEYSKLGLSIGAKNGKPVAVSAASLQGDLER